MLIEGPTQDPTTCPTCGQPREVRSVMFDLSGPGEIDVTYVPTPEPQLWLCRDKAGVFQLRSRPSVSGIWEAPDFCVDLAWCDDDDEALGKRLNLLPGEAIGLHTGEKLQGGNHAHAD